jgi:hypothetical protein
MLSYQAAHKRENKWSHKTEPLPVSSVAVASYAALQSCSTVCVCVCVCVNASRKAWNNIFPTECYSY